MLHIALSHQLQLNKIQIQIQINDDEPKIYAIQGPSGIGKTTILNIIAGLTQPDSAFIKIGNKTLTDTKVEQQVKIQKRNIGYLFQDYQLFPHMTVLQNLTFMTPMSQHITQLMQKLNISDLVKQYPATLSGGEAQRVALARALSTKPDLILLDEPFSSLDDLTKENSMSMVRTIFELWQIPMIFVTHSNFEAQQLADEIITIEGEKE
ncbi:Sulfate/thiosulfate import ATP-binding protein CysA [Staphylococcus arlettae]|uniref:ATP-binding cassette domain-containing protein n=1 Tax=Staphylococcus arlettae TaxID=29378 RepID=UPI00190A41BB|nr:ATP-binding cassette domain-containing protein [Staphylococcus arlettae]MBK3719717.1 Sulfate/thiosulfate import ATP-binding protein CysA [Staphylococcus arlettae]